MHLMAVGSRKMIVGKLLNCQVKTTRVKAVGDLKLKL